MLNGYHILTLTHRDASLETIGQVVVPSDDAPQTLQALKMRFGWDELLYLGTCNRVTLLFYTQSPVDKDIAIRVLPILRPDLSASVSEKIAAQMRLLQGAEAVRHLFEVAGSMDSLVVGEREIIRQLREAYDRSYAWGLTGDHLRLLIRFTIETAKEIYSQTGIGEKALSVVALAFAEMQKVIGQKNLARREDMRILLVGAGQTNALFAKFLTKSGYANVTIFNRTLEKAEALAHSPGWKALPLDVLEHYSEGFDALVVCTGSTQAIVTPALYDTLLAGDTARKVGSVQKSVAHLNSSIDHQRGSQGVPYFLEHSRKVVVDLSVPNNVDKRILNSYPIQFIEIEDLKTTARENLAHRERESLKAEAIISERILAYRDLWHERQVERSLAHIPDEVRAVKERAIFEVYGKEFAQLDAPAQELMLKILGYMEKKCIAIPMKAAKTIALRGRGKNEQVGEKIN